MPEIPFTQYMRPYGRPIEVSIERPIDICNKATQIIKAGYRFEAEVLTTGHVSISISNDEADQDIEIINNGPDVPLAVDRMINRFYDRKKSEWNNV